MVRARTPHTSCLFSRCSARKEKAEARMAAIERGEIQAEDPRAQRERELKEQQQAKLRRAPKPAP